MKTISLARGSFLFCLQALLILAAVPALTGRLDADPAPPAAVPAPAIPDTVLYAGDPLSSAPFDAESWGGGAVDTIDYPSVPGGKQVLKIDTIGPYQGALLTFNPPALLGNIKKDRTRFLDMLVAVTPPPPAASVSRAPDGLLHLAQYQQPAYPNPAMQNPGTAGKPDSAPSAPAAPKTIQSLRFVFTLASGVSFDTIRVLPPFNPSDPWVRVGIPLANLPLTSDQAADAQIKSIMIAGDKTGTFYIAKMSLVDDSTPVTGSIEGSRDVDLNSYQAYTAHGAAGPTNLTYRWHFADDDTTPSGPNVTHKFLQSGDFKVAVTILDVDNLKPGIVVTTSVHVEAP